ncbi:MAG: hypothetical protein WC421_03420 [Elusimicrobiales bacterium]
MKKLIIFSAALAQAMALYGCRKPVVETGARVELKYSLYSAGKFVEAKVVSCSYGSCGLPPALETELAGKTAGAVFKLHLPPEKAYPYQKELVHEVAMSLVPKDRKPVTGDKMEAATSDGKKLACVIKDTGRKHIVLDCNHPLAGKTLDYEAEIISVNK